MMIVSVSCSFCLSSVWRWKLPAESYRNGESYPMLICQMNKLLTFAIQSLTPAGYLWANDIVAHILYHSLSFHSVGENTVTIPNPLFLLKNNLTTEGIFFDPEEVKNKATYVWSENLLPVDMMDGEMLFINDRVLE